jgi:hypothetical protein
MEMARALRASTDDILLATMIQRIARKAAEDGEVVVHIRADELINSASRRSSRLNNPLLEVRGSRVDIPAVMKLLQLKGFHFWDGDGQDPHASFGMGYRIGLGWLSWGAAGQEVFRRYGLRFKPAHSDPFCPNAPWTDEGVLDEGYYSHLNFERYWQESETVQDLGAFILFHTRGAEIIDLTVDFN